MAFDRDFHEVLDEFAMMDSARQNDENSQLYKDKIDMMNLEAKIGVMNNPMNFLTPILIACLVIVAILAVICICGLGFCWYVRFHNDKPREYSRQYQFDPENPGQISLKNINEEKVQFINNVYRTMKMREKADSADSSEVNVPLAGDGMFESQEFTPIHTPSRKGGFDRSSGSRKHTPSKVKTERKWGSDEDDGGKGWDRYQ